MTASETTPVPSATTTENKGDYKFRLPEDDTKIIEVVRVIPDYWVHISANLWATRAMYDAGKVAQDTRLLRMRGDGLHTSHIGPMYKIVGSRDSVFEYTTQRDRLPSRRLKLTHTEDPHPDIDGIAIGKRFSSFDLDLFGPPPHYSLEESKRFLKSLLSQGYRGRITGHGSPQWQFIDISHFDRTVWLGWSCSGRREAIDPLAEELKAMGLEVLVQPSLI